MSYEKLVMFGDSLANRLPVYNNDPITLCLGTSINQPFNHGSNGSIYGQNSPECQVYMSQRCATKWDDICEHASNVNSDNMYSIRADTMGRQKSPMDLSSSDILLRNTAMEKYRITIGGTDCHLRTEPFDPINPSSPYMSYYVGTDCVSEYAVNPATIDQDPVMNKILERPHIAILLLTNIRNTMKRRGTYNNLYGTKLWNFYESN